jgi:hypothetical protein
MVSRFDCLCRTSADCSLDKADDGKGRQATTAQSPEAATDEPDKTKSKTATATPDKLVPSETTDASQTGDVGVVANAPDAPGDKSADSAPSSSKTESTQAQTTTQEEVAAKSELKKDPALASTPAVAPDTTPPPPVPENTLPEKSPDPQNDANVTKLHTPTSEPAASAPAKSNGEPEVLNAPDADAKDASETPAQTEASVKPGNIEKPDGVATEPAPQTNQNDEAGGAAKSDDSKSGGPVKPTLRLDHIREASTASTMSASSPGTPGDEFPLSSVDDVDASGARLTKNQKKKMRERARKQAQQAQQSLKGEKNSPRPSSGATSNSVDNSVVQEPKPVATAPVDVPVDVPVGEGDGVFVDGKTESGEDDAPVIVEKSEAATTSAEEKTTDTADEDWSWW